MIAELALMASICAPNVHTTTLQAVVKHESSGNPFAIGINKGAPRLKKQPQNKEDAIAIVKSLRERKINFDAGLGQINFANWEWLGLTPETVFDPCINLKAAETVLVDCYQRATKQFPAGHPALMAGLSCYNTGNFKSGFINGYVNQVLASAGIKVPALNNTLLGATPTQKTPKPTPLQEKPTNQVPEESESKHDAFAKPKPDAFAEPRKDAFEKSKTINRSVGTITYHGAQN